MQGLFIALEGIDGSGTTTQSARMALALRGMGYEVHTTQEPSSLFLGKHIRSLLSAESPVWDETLALLFAADRLEHIRHEIQPLLKKGCVVISDRYTWSSLAYQGFVLPMDWVASVNRYAQAPRCSFFLNVTPETALKRRLERGGVEERFDALEKQRAIAQAYEKALQYTHLLGEVVQVDAEQEVGQVTSALLAHVTRMSEAGYGARKHSP